MTEQQDFQQPTNIGAHEQELLRKRHRVVPEPHDVVETVEDKGGKDLGELNGRASSKRKDVRQHAPRSPKGSA